MSINERIGYGDASYSADYSQFSCDAEYGNRAKVLPTNSASYANAGAHNLASYVTNNYGRINEILARHWSAKTHDSDSHVALQQDIQILIFIIRLHVLLVTILNQ